MGYVFGYDEDAEEGPIVGRDTFGEPIRKWDRNVVVGKTSLGEPITAKEVHDAEQEDSLLPRHRDRHL